MREGVTEPAPDELFFEANLKSGLGYMHFGKQDLFVESEIADLVERLTLEAATREEKLRKYYRVLLQVWGPQNWWPAQSRFEMIVGAFLTQNTAWTNVEKALANLRAAKALRIRRIRDMPIAKLEELIRPSGYFRQKAARLKTFVEFLDRNYSGSLSRMFTQPTPQLREELLALNGVGPETADSILLYAGNHPVFVVDAYTRRILARHELFPEDATYEEIRELFQHSLAALAEAPGDAAVRELQAAIGGAPHLPSTVSSVKRTALVQVYNEMHGLIVGVGKNYCKKSQPQCDGCPLQPFLPGLK